jgi:hypothetical protein
MLVRELLPLDHAKTIKNLNFLRELGFSNFRPKFEELELELPLHKEWFKKKGMNQ